MGSEALALARAEQKPIFLSIGYASCHWCHVMAHESFEDPEIARLLNEHFVSIKVDREERLDLDQIYMEAVQMMTGRGGWPMSVFLTPEGEPFFGGTYWPPRAAAAWPASTRCFRPWPTPGNTAAPRCSNRPRRSRSCCGKSRRERKKRRSETATSAPPADLDDTPLQAAEAALRRSFDPQWGGFGPAPKFPQPLALRWLLRRWRRSGDDELLRWSPPRSTAWPPAESSTISAAASTATASTPAGWCRISRRCSTTTPCWPSATSKPGRRPASDDYAAVVRQTLDYLLRDMTDPQGGFYSGEDADSEGEEGKFYLWTPGEIEAVLGPEAGRALLPRVRRDRGGQFRRPKHPQPAAAVGGRGQDARPRAGRVGGRIGRRPAGAACGPGEARPPRPRRKGAGRLEQSGHRRPGPSRRGARRAALHGGGQRRPISSGIISAATTAACCTTGATARPSTTPISTTTPAWATPC